VTQLEGILLVLGALRRDGVEYRLLGGEVDCCVCAHPEEVPRVKRVLHSIWSDRGLDEMQDRDSPRFRYNPPGEEFWIEFVWSAHVPPLDIPRGVRKFRSIEEMSASREHYEMKRLEKLVAASGS
jgi:hypothetical protein